MPTWERLKKPIKRREARVPVAGQRAWADFMISTLTRSRFFFVSLQVQVLAGLHRFWEYASLPVLVLLSMGVLMAQMSFAGSGVTNDGAVESTTRKALFVIVDGIPADVIERVSTPGIDAVASKGSYQRAYVGGELGMPTESPTVSAVGYMSLITGTWSNKHNVRANYGMEPSYAFWDIFRVAKNQARTVTTGLFSTWTDNRTILVGDGLEAAGGYKVDFVADGFEKDPAFAPALDDLDRIQAIDLHVTTVAATTIVEAGPDLSWVYLQHTDDIGHRDGDGSSMDLAVRWMDTRVAELWSAVQARKKKSANEDWLVLVTTDHGRMSSDGRGHGGQSDRERTIWIASNSPRIVLDRERTPAIVDIYPTIVEHMRFELPAEVATQLEGQSLLSK
jgi:predicted AlkP superfamily pyrophosphatase or phosphodiesterase